MVTLFFLLILGCVFSWMAVAKKNILVGIISSVIWLLTFYYTHNVYQIGGFSAGSSGDTMGVVIFFGLAIAIPLISWSFWRGEKKYSERDEQEYQFKQKERKADPTYSDVTSTSNSVNLQDMSDAEYLRLLQNQSRKNKR